MGPRSLAPGATVPLNLTPNHWPNSRVSVSARHTRDRGALRRICFSIRSVLVWFCGMSSFLLWMAKQCFERFESFGPQFLVRAQPIVGLRERFRVEPAVVGPAAHGPPHQPSVFERLGGL